jgi:hypothetical protein
VRILKIVTLAAVAVALLCVGSLLPWRVLAENLAAFDGSAYAALKTASLANYIQTVGGGATFLPGALVTEKGPRFGVTNSPGAGNAAVATIAANATGRHVADCVGWSVVSTGAVTATDISIVLRDGATGAGTILRTFQVAVNVAAATGIQVVPIYEFCGLNLVGTTNTAMTLEMSAGVANAQPTAQFTTFLVQ